MVEQNIVNEITAIKNRNARVEADKAWETSKTRILSLCLITYFVAVIILYILGNNQYFINALIPTLGFFLSTQSLPFIKKWWLKSIYHD